MLPLGVVEAASAGASGGTTCKSFSGNAKVTPGLPVVGSRVRVRPTVSIKGAKLSGCHGVVTGGTASATLKFATPSNCLVLVTRSTANIVSRAKGTLRITWNNGRTSTLTFSLSFGAVKDKPTLAATDGTVTSGLFKGMKGSGTVLWSLGTNECFGGEALTSLRFSGFGQFVMK
jgi:hypothetical protein